MKKKILLFIIVFFNCILVVLQVFVSHKLASSNEGLKNMQNEIESLSLDNELLKSEIATASSLTTIAKKADASGFRRATFLYMENLPVAFSK